MKRFKEYKYDTFEYTKTNIKYILTSDYVYYVDKK